MGSHMFTCRHTDTQTHTTAFANTCNRMIRNNPSWQFMVCVGHTVFSHSSVLFGLKVQQLDVLKIAPAMLWTSCETECMVAEAGFQKSGGFLFLLRRPIYWLQMVTSQRIKPSKFSCSILWLAASGLGWSVNFQCWYLYLLDLHELLEFNSMLFPILFGINPNFCRLQSFQSLKQRHGGMRASGAATADNQVDWNCLGKNLYYHIFFGFQMPSVDILTFHWK